MTIGVDATPYSIVVWCSECPGFREHAHDKTDGWRKAAGHEKAVHPGRTSAQMQLSKKIKKL